MFRIQKLGKKIRYIQNTRFYKEINKAPTYLRVVHPTNILLKDRLYNFCFKFYRSLVTYPDRETLMRDFSLYYSMMLLRALRKQGFELSKTAKKSSQKLTFDDQQSLVLPDMTLENARYRVAFKAYRETSGIVLQIENKQVQNANAAKATHLLLFSPQSSFVDISELNINTKEYTTVEAISLWNMAYLETYRRKSSRNRLFKCMENNAV